MGNHHGFTLFRVLRVRTCLRAEHSLSLSLNSINLFLHRTRTTINTYNQSIIYSSKQVVLVSFLFLFNGSLFSYDIRDTVPVVWPRTSVKYKPFLSNPLSLFILFFSFKEKSGGRKKEARKKDELTHWTTTEACQQQKWPFGLFDEVPMFEYQTLLFSPRINYPKGIARNNTKERFSSRESSLFYSFFLFQ